MTLRDHLQLRVAIAAALALATVALASAWTIPAVLRALHCTAHVEGVVAGHSPRGRDSTYLIVKYSVQGHAYSVRESHDGGVQGPVTGDSIEVSYNPDDPAEASVHPVDDVILAALANGTLLLAAGFAISFCVWRHRKLAHALPQARTLHS